MNHKRNNGLQMLLAIGWSAIGLFVLTTHSFGQASSSTNLDQATTELPGDWYGDWSLQLQSKTPTWMSIRNRKGHVEVRLRLYVGSDGPHKNVRFEDNQLSFTLRRNKNAKGTKRFVAKLENDQLTGSIISVAENGTISQDSFTSVRIPPLPEQPVISDIRFGHPVRLFNGKDLSGWQPHEPHKINGWRVENGLLVNNTPKTDFSATGAYANLRTKTNFHDFWLHLEFLVEENRNSGVYLRGMYEAQVVDRNSRMQGIQGVGAIFGKIKPSKNAGKLGGQWQSYDLTLVDRHITVVLNGEKVIDNQAIEGPTAGAILTDPAKPGPIYLQGDHTQVKYRNIYLAPVIKP